MSEEEEKKANLQNAEGEEKETTEVQNQKSSTKQVEASDKKNKSKAEDENKVEDAQEPTESNKNIPALKENKSPDKDDDPLNEIDESNAEDAEDDGHKDRHEIPLLDYHSLSMEKLVDEIEKLVKNEKIQAIKNHVDEIKQEFDLKFQELLEQKKDDFIENGGNEIDFKYNSPLKTRFNTIYSDYRDKRNQHYKSLEQNLKTNLKVRLEISF